MKPTILLAIPVFLLLSACSSNEEHPSVELVRSFPAAACDASDLNHYPDEFVTSDFMIGWKLMEQGSLRFDQAADMFAMAVEKQAYANLSSLYYDYLVSNLMGQNTNMYTHFRRGQWHYASINYGEPLGPMPELTDEEVQWVYLQAQCGEPNEAFALGSMYLYGLVFQEDRQMAIEFLTIAAEQDHVRAQYRLGLVYSEARDYEQAYKWLRIAEENGHPDVGDYDQYVEMLL